MANSLFKKAWNGIFHKSVGDDMNVDLHLIMLHKARIDALKKDDWAKVAELDKEIERWEAKAKQAKKDIGIATAGPVPGSLLARQDLEGETSESEDKLNRAVKAQKKSWLVTTRYRGDAQEHTLQWTVEAETRDEAIELGKQKTLQKEGPQTFGPYYWWTTVTATEITKTQKSSPDPTQSEEDYGREGPEDDDDDKDEKKKIIHQEGDKWILYSHEGKVLGRHPSKEAAERQERAVEANKHKSVWLDDASERTQGNSSIQPNEYDVAVGTSWINEDGKSDENVGGTVNANKKMAKNMIDNFLKKQSSSAKAMIDGYLAKTSRVYGDKHIGQDEAYDDLKKLVEENEGRISQAYIDYDKETGMFYACVTLNDQKVVELSDQDMATHADSDVLSSTDKGTEKSQIKKKVSDNQAKEMLLNGGVEELRRKLVVEDKMTREEANTKIAELRQAVRTKEEKPAPKENVKESKSTDKVKVRKNIDEFLAKWAGGPDYATFGSTVPESHQGRSDTLTEEQYGGSFDGDNTDKDTYGGVGHITFNRDKDMKKDKDNMGVSVKEQIENVKGWMRSHKKELEEAKKLGKKDMIRHFEEAIAHDEKVLSSLTKSVEKELNPVDRPKQPLYNVKDKDVLERAKELLEQINDEDIVRRTLSQEFGFSNSEVSEVFSCVLGAVDPDKNDGRQLDPHSIQGQETSVGKSLYPFKDVLNGKMEIKKSTPEFRKTWDKITKKEGKTDPEKLKYEIMRFLNRTGQSTSGLSNLVDNITGSLWNPDGSRVTMRQAEEAFGGRDALWAYAKKAYKLK